MLLATNGFMAENLPTKYDKLVDSIKNNPEYKKEILLNKLIGFYRIGSEIGIGNFSKVKLGLHLLTKEKVAIKILNKLKLDNKTQRLLLREISSMQKLHHPNIIRLYEVIHTQERLFICMEYASEGELYSKVSNDGRINEIESRIIFSQIISAVDHLHFCNIIHRDIKAENIFFSTLNPINVKLGDFGFSIEATIDRQLNTYCGSPPYAAPELFRDDHYTGIYVDIWALGVLLYFMVTGQTPFRADTVGKLKRIILNGDYTIPSFVSETCQFLIKGILRPVPIDRFSIKEIMHSAWLDSEKFSQPLLSFQFNPGLEQSKLSKEEVYSLKILESLGISNQHLILSNINDNSDPTQRQNSQMNNLISSRVISNFTNTVNDSQINLTYELKQSINGTYRIIFHMVQKKLRKENLKELESNSFFANEFSSVYSNDSAKQVRNQRMRKNSCHSDDYDDDDSGSRNSRHENSQINQKSNSVFVKLNTEKNNSVKISKPKKLSQNNGTKIKYTNFTENNIGKKSTKQSSKFCSIL